MDNYKIQILFDNGLFIEYDSLDELAESSKIPKDKLRHMIATKKRIPGIIRLTTTTLQTDTLGSTAVAQYDELGNEVHRYKNANEAHKYTGINNIYKALNGIVNTAGGYTWKYIDSTATVAQPDNTEIVLLSDACEITGVYQSIDEAANNVPIEKSIIEHSLLELTRTEAGYFVKVKSKNSEIIELNRNGLINNIYKKLSLVRLNTGLTNSQICNSYTRNAYIGDVKYMRLEMLLKSIHNED